MLAGLDLGRVQGGGGPAGWSGFSGGGERGLSCAAAGSRRISLS